MLFQWILSPFNVKTISYFSSKYRSRKDAKEKSWGGGGLALAKRNEMENEIDKMFPKTFYMNRQYLLFGQVTDTVEKWTDFPHARALIHKYTSISAFKCNSAKFSFVHFLLTHADPFLQQPIALIFVCSNHLFSVSVYVTVRIRISCVCECV